MSYDRRTAARSLPQLQQAIEQVMTLVEAGDFDRAFRVYLALKGELQGMRARGDKASFMWMADPPERLRGELDKMLGQWQTRQQRRTDALATVPKARELLEHLQEVQRLQLTLGRDPGAYYFAPWLERLDTSELIGILNRFLGDHT